MSKIQPIAKNHTEMGPDFTHSIDIFDDPALSNVCGCRVETKYSPYKAAPSPDKADV